MNILWSSVTAEMIIRRYLSNDRYTGWLQIISLGGFFQCLQFNYISYAHLHQTTAVAVICFQQFLLTARNQWALGSFTKLKIHLSIHLFPLILCGVAEAKNPFCLFNRVCRCHCAHVLYNTVSIHNLLGLNSDGELKPDSHEDKNNSWFSNRSLQQMFLQLCEDYIIKSF